jgi:hypothetical protein
MTIGWRKAKSFSPRRFAVQQNSLAVLPYIHCNEHRANDLENHSLPNLSFGSEINRILD